MIDEIGKTDLISGRIERMEIPCHNRLLFRIFEEVLMNMIIIEVVADVSMVIAQSGC